MNAVRNCALGNLDAELHQFSVDAACTQEEFAVAIFLTSAAVSVVTGGRPPDRRGPVVATSAVGLGRGSAQSASSNSCQQPDRCLMRSAPHVSDVRDGRAGGIASR
jgi:hypothetical protein